MAQPTPTFKLVLVGDGGTGKVCCILEFRPLFSRVFFCDTLCLQMVSPTYNDHLYTMITYHDHLDAPPLRSLAREASSYGRLTWLDHLCQASLDWRVRKEVHGHTGC